MLLAAGLGVSVIVLGCGSRSPRTRPGGPGASPSRGLIRALSAEARHPIRSSAVGGIHLQRSYDGDVWRFAYFNRGRLACWVLVVPRRSSEGTCGTRAQLAARALEVYAVSRTGRSGTTVVYGWLSPRVRKLSLRLSDCSDLRVSIRTRPIFWTFIPMTRPSGRTLIYPTEFSATLAGGGIVRRQFAPMGSSPPGRC
jgi:hypothetical protein